MSDYFSRRICAEIDLDAARSNLLALKDFIDESCTKPACVVKADAYGHGDVGLMKLYQKMGVDFFCVSNISEALRLREGGCTGDILILSWTAPEDTHILIENNLIGTAVSVSNAAEMSANAEKPVRLHIKLDTGMGRVGLNTENAEKCAAEIAEIAAMKNIAAEGLFTHLAVADSAMEESVRFTEKQKNLFFEIAEMAEQLGVKLIHRHCLNSAGTLYHYDRRSTLARMGIVLYGLKPDSSLDVPVKLEPVMKLKSFITQIKTISAGTSVSYGRTYIADSDRVVATVPCGYADGYPRLLSNKNEVLVHGRRAKGIGRICMDQMMIDITGIDGVKVGDEVTLFGRDGDELITADDVASSYGTIGYELICGVSVRVPRIFISKGEIKQIIAHR
ncbi:MAG: alanine racemase [Oscillospiraceae bacterium]|nr:alanine racemase [Oscillospiraceae bacterium]